MCLKLFLAITLQCALCITLAVGQEFTRLVAQVNESTESSPFDEDTDEATSEEEETGESEDVPSSQPEGKPAPKKNGAAKPDKPNPTKQGQVTIKPIQRPTTPPAKPNPEELKARPNGDGLLQFQFQNQPWPDVLKWLADVSKLSLDWQELPGDYINLSTQRPYTLDETKDALNRALLIRGYTMLEHEETLTVAKTEGINPSLVPRVPPERLRELPPHSFVRTTFELSWLLAEDVHTEFGSMLSKNGKLTPLMSTNRIEGMDAAANLREIHDILTREQSAVAQENLAEEFQLTHAKASQVKADIEVFLGIQSIQRSSSSRSSEYGQLAQAQQQLLQQLQQMQQQQQRAAKAGTPGVVGKPRSDRVYIIANDRANSLIVHAPPDKKAIIAAFIRRVDVPNEMATDFERMKIRTKVFRLATLSPTELVASLNAMDVLEPTTKLQVNEENKSVIAYASISDQYLIQGVIDRLDGSQRSFHVKNLRRLNAADVAGSIRFLMGAEEEKNNSPRDFGYYFDPWGGYSQSRSSSSKKEVDKMRVTANVRDNQILLWVNEIELEEIENLLVKLGELPPAGGNRSTIRVIEATRQRETLEYLKRLKAQFEKVAPNRIELPSDSAFDAPKSQDDSPFKSGEETSEGSETMPRTNRPAGDTVTSLRGESSSQGELSAANIGTLTSALLADAATEMVQSQSTGGATEDEKPLSASDENKTRRSENQSLPQPSDTVPEANETPAVIENAAKSQTKGRKRLPPALADLDQTVADQTISDQAMSDQPQDGSVFQSMIGGPYRGARPTQPAPAPITFSIDERGNLIVQSSDTAALDLIEQWMIDNKPPQRKYDVFKVKYARASWVCLNLKEYFSKERESDRRRSFSWEWEFFGSRDRSKDDQQLGKRPELQFIYDNDTNSIVVRNADDLQRQTIQELIQLWDIPDPKQKDESNTRFTKLIPIRHTRAELVLTTVKEAYRDLLSANDKTFDKNSEEKRESSGLFSYRGKLSLGADEVSNSILVSAEGKQLFTIVCDMIRELDDAAKEAGVIRVMSIGNGLNATSVEGALKAIIANSRPKPEKAPKSQEQEEQPEQRQPQQNASSNNSRSNRSSR